MNSHSVSVRSQRDRVVPEIILWGEASWWPKNCQMRFTRTNAPGVVKKGTRYRQSVLLPFAPSWNVEVTMVTPSSITRTFLDGMFRGHETVSVKSESEGMLVRYEMFYDLKGPLNKILWPLIFQRMHDANIEMILKSLKEHCETRERS